MILRKRKKDNKEEENFSFSSTINISQRELLEQIFFFNKEQTRYASVIKQVIKLYGQPEVTEDKNKLSLDFGKINCQSLFCTVNQGLVGLAVFYRDSPENIDLIHIAVDKKYNANGKYADQLLMFTIMNEIKKIALRIKDVETITLKYNQKRVIKVSSGLWNMINYK